MPKTSFPAEDAVTGSVFGCVVWAFSSPPLRGSSLSSGAFLFGFSLYFEAGDKARQTFCEVQNMRCAYERRGLRLRQLVLGRTRVESSQKTRHSRSQEESDGDSGRGG